MATLLYRLGKTAYRRWPRFLAAWLIAMLTVGTVAATLSKPMTDAFSIPGIPSEKAADLQAELFPGAVDAFDQATVKVVVAAPEGHELTEPTYSSAVDDLVADLEQLPQMPAEPALANPATAGPEQVDQMVQQAVDNGTPADVAEANARAFATLSEDGRVGTITWDFDVDTVADVEPATIEALHDVMEQGRDAGLTVEANGSGSVGMMELGGSSELIGVAVALLVLILTFGSLVAAGLPIITALFGVALGVTGITAMTALTDVGSTTPMLATMIGLAVGIDYALFILARYRSELQHTDDREEAVGRRGRHRRLRGRVRRPHGPHRAVGAGRGPDPVPHHDGRGRRGHRADRGARRADPAAGVPRPAQVQGVRRPGAALPAGPRGRRLDPQQRGPLGPPGRACPDRGRGAGGRRARCPGAAA